MNPRDVDPAGPLQPRRCGALRQFGLGAVAVVALWACSSDSAETSDDPVTQTTSSVPTATPAEEADSTGDVRGDTSTTVAETDSDADVEAARDGLGRYLDEHRPDTPQTSTNIEGCPAISVEQVNTAMSGVGLSDTLEDWGTEIEWSEYEDLHRDLMGIVCGGDSDGDAHGSDIETMVSIFAVDVADLTTFEQLVAEFDLGEVDGPDESGWASVSGCDEWDGAPACIEFRHRDGLVLGVQVASATDDVDVVLVTTLFDSITGDVLASLAAV